tara:strand:- start:675 stop:938 length:264 start_codon:yes stop_codon:yes gene_type:complete
MNIMQCRKSNKARNRDFKSEVVKLHLRRKFRGMSMWDRLKLLQLEYQKVMYHREVALQAFTKRLDKFPKKEPQEEFTWNLQKMEKDV